MQLFYLTIVIKFAVVKPLYKKGDKASMTSYRAVSLLMVFSKVTERAMHSRLSQHLHTDNILITEQYSFRKGISIEDAAFILTDSVLKSANHTMHVGGIFCDLAKAFDGINHEIFLAKLHFYESRGVSEDGSGPI